MGEESEGSERSRFWDGWVRIRHKLEVALVDARNFYEQLDDSQRASFRTFVQELANAGKNGTWKEGPLARALIQLPLQEAERYATLVPAKHLNAAIDAWDRGDTYVPRTGF